MGSSASCDDSVSASIGFNSRLYGLKCESRLLPEHSFYGNIEKDVKNVLLVEDLDSSSSEEDFDDLVVKELGSSFYGALQIEEPAEFFCVMDSLPNQQSICNQMDAMEGLNEHAELMHLELVNSDAGDELSCAILESVIVSDDSNAAFLKPLPTPARLISALKGSRAQHGIRPNTKLSVKWAPEVYDPPITSSSHTVKGHHRQHRHHHHHHSHQRAKAKKDYSHNRYVKGRSTRAIVSERKHAPRRSSSSSQTDPPIVRSEALGCNGPLLNGCVQSKIESLDVAVKSCEVLKYGSGCYAESLAPLQLSVAKAS